jgi:hypothetical protein
MAGMPDLQTFASPVRVEGPRAIGSYDLSPIAAGDRALETGQKALASGMESVGKGAQAVGTAIATEKESTDRYNYAVAKASFNIDNTNLHASLANNTDYPSLTPTYTTGAQGAQSRWADTIDNPALKQRFNAETGGTIAAGQAQQQQRAFGLEGQTKVVDLDDRGKTLSDQAVADPMNEGKFGGNLKDYGDMVDGLVEQGHLTPTLGAAKKDAWAHSAGVGVGLARADIDPQAAINETRAMPGTPEQIDNRILQIEGPGKDKRSSAVGGFIDDTWLNLIKQNRPDLAQGKSDEDILALRADSGLRNDMTKTLREQNTASFKSQGIDATPGNIYLGHMFGAGAASAIIKADPKRPLTDVLMDVYHDPAKVQGIVDANPQLRGQLAGSVAQTAAGKMGGAIPGGGHIYDWLDDNQRRQIASYAQNRIETTTLDNQSQLKQRIEDTAAEAARTGYASNPVSQSEFVRAQGTIDGPKAYTQYQAGLKTAADISNVARMTADQQNELVKSYEPKPGEGYEAAAERQVAVQKAVIAVRKERDADPANYAITRIPAVGAAFKNFSDVHSDPTASIEAKSLAARDYINKTTDRQIAAGVAPEDVKIVPARYVDNLDKTFTSVATSEDGKARQGLIARVLAEKQMWGDAWPRLVNQLPDTTQPAVRAIAAGADPVAMARILALNPKESPVAILKEQDEVTARNMTKAVNSSLGAWRGTLVGPQQDAFYTGYNGLVQKLAAIYVRDGQSAETAADSAYKSVVGDRYDIRDSWRAPKDPHVDIDAVQRGTQVARDQLARGNSFSDNFDQANKDLGLTPQEQALYKYHLANLKGESGIDNPDGSRSSIKNITVESDGRHYILPTVAGGKFLTEDEAWARAKSHLSEFPSYGSEKEASDRYDAMHKYMEQDTGAFQAARTGNPFGSIRLNRNEMGVSDNEADSRRGFVRNGRFVTAPNEDGLNMADGQSSFVSGKDGKPILLPWADLARMGSTKAARAAEASAAVATSSQTP